MCEEKKSISLQSADKIVQDTLHLKEAVEALGGKLPDDFCYSSLLEKSDITLEGYLNYFEIDYDHFKTYIKTEWTEVIIYTRIPDTSFFPHIQQYNRPEAPPEIPMLIDALKNFYVTSDVLDIDSQDIPNILALNDSNGDLLADLCFKAEINNPRKILYDICIDNGSARSRYDRQSKRRRENSNDQSKRPKSF